MREMVWSGHSPAWRAAAVLATLLLIATAWFLGSPLFIRTTLVEELPGVPAATAAAPAPPTGTTTEATAGARPPTAAPAAAGPAIVSEGRLGFVDPLHHGEGPARVLQIGAQRVLRFEGVAITNAPDVHVYLSREMGGKWSEATSLYLGPLKATNGSFSYDIPASADLAAYRSVVVWCRAFSVLVTWADLLRPPEG